MAAMLESIRKEEASKPLLIVFLGGLVSMVFLLGFGAVVWRVNKAPDVFTDEIIYTRIGVRISGEGAMVWDSGEPFLVHPPLYFLAQGVYGWIAGEANTPIYGAGDIFGLVYQARWLNAVFAGLTAVILFLIGRRVRGIWLGLLMAVVFSLDPFGVRINRRAMLETLAVLLSLGGIGLLLMERRKRQLSGLITGILAGMTLGLALLTKELAFINVLAVLFFGLWEGWRGVRSGKFSWRGLLAPMVSVSMAALTYAIYPLWILTEGYWELWVAEKILAFKRLLGLVQLTGWNRPEVSLLAFISQRMEDYGSSYLLLALGGAAVVWLLLMHRDRRTGRLLGTWGAVLYPFFGFIALFGSGNDQFFYLLLVPAILMSGYAFNAPIPTRAINGSGQRWKSMWLGISIATTGLLLLVFLPFNLYQWYTHYGSGEDQGYQKLTNFVQDQIPMNEPINASGDPIKFRYFLPERAITAAASSSEAMRQGVHYFVLAPKDVWARYGKIKPELANWITAEGERIFATSGDSYGDIYIYRVDYQKQSTQPVSVAERNNGAHWRSFQPAKGGFVGNLTLILCLWIILSGVFTAAIPLGKKILMVKEQGELDAQTLEHTSHPRMETHHEGT